MAFDIFVNHCSNVQSIQDYWSEWQGIARKQGKFEVSKMQYTYNKLCHNYGRMLWGDEDPSQVPEFAPFDGTTIGAVNHLLGYYSIIGMAGQLKNIEGIINYFPELQRIHGDDLHTTRAQYNPT